MLQQAEPKCPSKRRLSCVPSFWDIPLAVSVRVCVGNVPACVCVQEWLWPLGYFLRAKLNFTADEDCGALRHYVSESLCAHKAHIYMSHWLGLPELTNGNGAECAYSCPTQAWSIGTILDILHDLKARSSDADERVLNESVSWYRNQSVM
eukprot:TRINITY_DN10303_c0_g1_i1.p1 TRINITY_DN10303_c0_g1~~TRINITY_DN10303_c0_g1_i1.p1  ORF type:complete len:150 (-),score=20.62 TRINITY_DN10303_c0_g1_i1:299-748(-)